MPAAKQAQLYRKEGTPMKIKYLLLTPDLWCSSDTKFEQRAQAQLYRKEGTPMKIKHVLLVALTALGLSLASVGVTAPAIAGALGGGVTSDRAMQPAVVPETVTAGSKPGAAPGSNVIGVVAAPETVTAGRKPSVGG